MKMRNTFLGKMETFTMTDISHWILYHFKICIFFMSSSIVKMILPLLSSWFFFTFCNYLFLPLSFSLICLIVTCIADFFLSYFYDFISFHPKFLYDFFPSSLKTLLQYCMCGFEKFQCRSMQCLFSDFRARGISLS